jgi:cytochrome b561/polyisoprenoid-binding protein YceI
MSAEAQRYTAVAIVLHWAIAIAIVLMIPLGWWMGDALEDADTQAQAIAAYQLHKSVGLTVLALSLVRLAWRFMNRAPPLPGGMKPWERLVAKITHWAFYALIIALPLTGWLYVSTAWSVHDDRPLEVPTLYFGLFQVPHLFGLSHLAEETRAAVAGVLEFGHSKLAWGAIVLTALHVGAALKHQFLDRDSLLARMIPGLTRSAGANAGRELTLAVGLGAVAFATAAGVFLFLNPPSGANAPPAEVVHSHEQGDDHTAPDDVDAAPSTAATDDHNADGHTHAAAPTAANAPPVWTVNRGASSIAFTGTHAGVPFEGRFSQWRADIRFDPNNLGASAAIVTIQTASASDGVALHDQSLPGGEWFDVANHPTATFRTTSIRARGDGAYEARGTLTIKGRAIDTRLPFTLRIDGDRAVMEGATSVERREANLGMASDPDAEYVSEEIGIRVRVEATRAP